MRRYGTEVLFPLDLYSRSPRTRTILKMLCDRISFSDLKRVIVSLLYTVLRVYDIKGRIAGSLP